LHHRLPPLNLDHLRLLSDGRGIIQHALYSVPNRKSGYTTDDNSRALVVVTERYRLSGDRELLRLAALYLSFLLYTQRADGRFRNYVGYDMTYLDQDGSQDCQGRAAWACGVAANSLLPESMRRAAQHMFARLYPHAQRLTSPRGRAGVIRGIYHLSEGTPDQELAGQVRMHADALRTGYRLESGPGWHWFEAVLTYANASLPEAMFLAYQMLGDPEYLRLGQESLDFLVGVVLSEGKLVPVGTDGWYTRGSRRALFDQQPEEAESLVRCLRSAWRCLGDQRYLDLAWQAIGWFLGQNLHHVPLYNPHSGACFDGLTPEGVNQNQGAESTLAYLASHLTLEEWRLQVPADRAWATGQKKAWS